MPPRNERLVACDHAFNVVMQNVFVFDILGRWCRYCCLKEKYMASWKSNNRKQHLNMKTSGDRARKGERVT